MRDLLESSPALKVLVTSRAILHLSGEHIFGVPPLPFPDPYHLPELSLVMESPAIRLFVERAQAVNVSFRLIEQNTPVVAQICARLDGLPLAIELAAARTRLLSPQALLARLERQLETLTQGPRDAQTRQQTLRNTLAWSYDLLSPREQRLFRRLSVCVGGCELSAIEAIYQALGDETGDLFEDAASLLDKSLLQQRDPGEKEQGDLRLCMLGTIREFGLEILTEQGTLEDTRHAHASYYVRFAEEVEPHLRSTQQLRWLLRLEPAHENLRAALAYLLEQAKTQTGQEQAEQALRLCSALFWYWYLRRYLREGRAFLEHALAASNGGSPAVRAKTLTAIQREQGDKASIAETLLSFARVVTLEGDLAAACRLYEESLAFARAIEYAPIIAASLEGLGEMVVAEGKPAWAARLWGTAGRLREEIDATMFPLYRASYGRAMALACTELGEKTFVEAMQEGRGMSLEQVLATHDARAHPAPLETEPGSR